MKKTREETEITISRIMDAARIVFSKKGFDATRMEDIAQEAQVSRGTVYWHFENKDKLFKALMIRSIEKIDQMHAEVHDIGKTPLFRLHDVLFGYLKSVVRDEEFRSTEMLTFMSLFGDNEKSSERAGIQKDFIKAKHEVARQLMIEGVENGEIRDDIDPDILALASMGYACGMEIMWMALPEMFSLDDYAGNIARLFIEAIRK